MVVLARRHVSKPRGCRRRRRRRRPRGVAGRVPGRAGERGERSEGVAHRRARRVFHDGDERWDQTRAGEEEVHRAVVYTPRVIYTFEKQRLESTLSLMIGSRFDNQESSQLLGQ